MSGKRYELTNLNDFMQIPFERLALCWKEVGEGIMLARATKTLQDTISPDKPFEFVTPCVWVDDDEGNMEVTLMSNEDES